MDSCAAPAPATCRDSQGSSWAEGRAGLAEAVLEVGVQLLAIHCTSPQPFTPHPTGHRHGYCGQGTWSAGVMGQLRGGPCPSLPAGCPYSRAEDQTGQSWVCGDRVSFGETQKQGCRMPPTVPSSQTQHVWAQFGCRGSRGPGTDREEHTVLAPQEGTRVGSSRPAFSLFHPFSPFRHPLGITVSLQTKQSRGTAGQKRGPAGDRVGAPDCGLPSGAPGQG